MNAHPRLAIFLTITLALLGASIWSGALAIIWEADRIYAVPVIGSLVLLAVGYGWMGKWNDVAWIADRLPVVGLMGTVFGVLLAIRGLASIDDAARMRIFTEVGQSLVANFAGIAGYAWLSLLSRVCGGSNVQ